MTRALDLLAGEYVDHCRHRLAGRVAERCDRAPRGVRLRLLDGDDVTAGIPGEQIRAQRRDDEKRRDAHRRGLGKDEPELAHERRDDSKTAPGPYSRRAPIMG